MNVNNKVDVTVSFSLPFCLYLNDGAYFLSLDRNIKAEILLKKVRQEPWDKRLEFHIVNKDNIDDDAYYHVIRIIDGERDCIKGSKLKGDDTGYEIHEIEGGKGTMPALYIPPVYYNCELAKDERGLFRFTEVHIFIKQIERYNENIEYFYTALKIINRLSDVYRYVTKEYHIKRITEKDVMGYTSSISGSSGFHYCYSTSGIIPTREDISQDKHREIKRLLKDNEQIPISDLLLLDALYFMELGDYRRTIIESMIAIEPWIEKFVGKKLAEREVSNNHREDFFHVVTLAPQIKGLLKLLVKPEEIDYQLIDNLASTNSLRNKIIHEGFVNASRSDAEKAIDCTEKIISFIRENI